MENINTLLFKTLTQISKESRLIFKRTAPAPAASRGVGKKPKKKPKKKKGVEKPAGKPKKGAEKTKPLDANALKTKFKEMKAKWLGMVSPKHTTAFKTTIDTNIKQLEAKLKLVLKGKLDAKKIQEFTNKIKLLEKKAKVAQILDKKRRDLLNPTKLEAARKQVVKGIMDELKVPAPLRPTVEASINKSLGEVQSRIQKLMSALASGLSKASDKAIGTFAAKIAKLPAKAPTSIQDLLKVLGHYPDINKMVKEVLEYVEAVKIVIDKKGKMMREFLGTCLAVRRCEQALKAWYATAAGWLKNPKTMPKGQKLVQAVLKAQSRIIMAQVLGWLEKNKPKILKQLKDLLKKVPGTLRRGVDINIDAMLRFLQNYASFASTGAETKRKIAQILAKAISAVRPPLKVNMVVEGGADSQAINLSNSPGLVAGYKKFQGVAKRLLPLIKAKKGLGKLPQIQGHAKAIEAYANGGDPYKFLMKVTKNKTDKAAMEKWMGGGGVLNTLLFVSRSEDMAGEIGSTDNLFAHKNCVVGGYATTSGRAKRADRFSRVSFLAKNSRLRQSSVPSKPKKKLTPRQKAALKLKNAKDKLKAVKSKAERAKKSANDAIKAIKNDPKLDANNPQLKAKFSSIEAKIKEIDTALKPLPANATLTQINARTKKIEKLIKELNKLVADLNKLKTQLLAAKVPTKVPKVKPGKQGEYLGVKFKKTPDGKFVIVGGSKHKLTEKEFKIVVGVERPDEAYKKKKVDAVYVRNDIKPPKLSYNPSTKVITGEYEYRGNKLKITYNIKTGERKATLDPNQSGTLRPLLPVDGKKAAKLNLIKAVLKDGLPIDSIQVVPDPAEASVKTLKEHLVNGRWMEGLKLLLDQPKKDIVLITRCVEKLARTGGTNWNQLDTAKTKPLVIKIIKNYRLNFEQRDLDSFAALLGGQSTAGAFVALIKSPKLIGNTRTMAIQGGIALYPTNKIIAKYYLEEGFETTNITNDINIKAIKAYDGDWKNVKNEVMDFIVDQYTGHFDTARFKARIHDYLAAADPNNLPDKYDDAFDKVYPNLTAIQTLATKKKGAEVWAKRQNGLDLMDTNADRLFTVGDANIIKFVDKFTNLYSVDLGTVNTGNKSKAENILKRIEKSTNPKTLVLVEELIQKLKALPGGLSASIRTIEQQSQKRMKAAFDVATGAKKASYENRVAALKMFLTGGAYHDKTVNGVPAAKGAQGASRDKYMRGLLANVHYDQEKFDTATLTATLIAELPKERKEFVGYYQQPNTLNEPGMKMIMGNRNKIGVEAIKTLADKLAPMPNKASQALRLYKVIGMKEKAAEMLANVTDAAEKQFLKTLLDHVDKRYKDMTPAQREKVRAGLVKAYQRIVAVANQGNAATSREVQMRIIEQLFELSAHLGGTGQRDVLRLLDQTGQNGHLNRLASQAYTPPTPPARPNAAQLLILRAKELRAKVELRQVKLDPNAIRHTNINQLAEDLDIYQSALGQKALKKDYVDTLKKIYKQKHASLTPSGKMALAKVFLKAAEAHKDPKYLVGGFGNANLDIAETDFTTSAERVRYFVVLKEYIKAATHEPDPTKKLDLIAKSKKSKKEVADAYSYVQTPEGQYRAAEKYIQAGGTNLAAAKTILSRTTPPNLTVPQGRAETLIKRMPNLQVKIDTAAARGLKRLAFDTFKGLAGSQIDISILTGTGAPTPKEVMNTLKGARRTITPAGTNTQKTALLTTIQGLPEWVTLNPTQQRHVRESLNR